MTGEVYEYPNHDNSLFMRLHVIIKMLVKFLILMVRLCFKNSRSKSELLLHTYSR